MISEFFLNIIFGIVSGILELLPQIEWSVDTSAFQYFLDIVKVATYMLPWQTVAMIGSTVVVLTIFRIGIAVIKVIWDLLPLV